MITENLSTLKIHKLTKEQYDRELAAGRIDPNALYLTPEEEVDLSGYATKEDLSAKADAEHSHDDMYYTEAEIDSKLSAVNNSITNITNGSVVVKEAEHADSADSATTATNAESATKATQDGSGNVITSTYETKTDSAAKLAEAKAYTDSKTANIASTTVVDNKITAHNTSTTAHSDIRDLISALTTKVNNFLDVDDTTTDQLSEVLELIEANKGTLDSITSGKVNVSDIVDNLTTSNASKVLSAKQGVALKALIDALQEDFDGHTHAIADVTGLQSALDGKAAASHGTHVTFDSTNKPKMDGTAAFGTSTSVARADHIHPTDTSRASKTEFDTHVADTAKHITSTERTNWGAAYTHSQAAHAPSNAQANVIESIKVNGTAQTISSKSVSITVPTKASDIGAATADHTHTVDTALSTTSTNPVRNSVVTSAINTLTSTVSANTSSISSHTTAISNLQTAVSEIQEITSAEIQSLFAN